ncbi:MAG: hypothetical protein JNK41_01370 [Saprospiraceae bacterium]|nr:hypothetical protein [Saprospiraceae bacterium]
MVDVDAHGLWVCGQALAKNGKKAVQERKTSLVMNIFHKDFADFINAFENDQVQYILVGGLAVVLHGYNRTTGDMDLLVNPTEDNYYKMQNAFQEFGLPKTAIHLNEFLNPNEIDVFTFGRPPLAIDVMTKMQGVTFEEAYAKSLEMEVESLKVRIPKLV